MKVSLFSMSSSLVRRLKNQLRSKSLIFVLTAVILTQGLSGVFMANNALADAPESLAAINAGTEVYADFAIAGVVGAIEANKAAYDTVIAGEKAWQNRDLILSEIQFLVEKTNTTVNPSADQAAAQIVIDQINALPAIVTLADADAVWAAGAAYAVLTDVQKALVSNYSILQADDAAIAALQAADPSADQTAAQIVIDQINALPAIVTLADADAVWAAGWAYAILTANQKALVSNYSILQVNDAAIATLQAADQTAAQAVITQINALPVTIALTDAAAVLAARSAYNALTINQQAMVSNYSILQADEVAIAALQTTNPSADQIAAQIVINQINALPAIVVLADTDAVWAAGWSYTALTANQKTLVSNYLTLKIADTAITALQAAANAAAADAAAAKTVSSGSGSSSGGGSFYLPPCNTVVYSDWGACFNGVQYRDVLSQTPNYCTFTSIQQAVRSKNCNAITSAVPATQEIFAQKVLGVQTYANGTLLRGSDKKIYVVSSGMLFHIKNSKELVKYTGKEIMNVADSVIISFPKTAVLGAQAYADGTLLRGSDKKIYVVSNGILTHIKNLKELVKYAGKGIINVANSVIAQY